MPTDEAPSQRCELYEHTDLLGALDRRMIEYLDVTDYWTIVIYGEAVLELRTTDGTLTDAIAFTVESKGFSRRASDPDPAAIITDFCDDLVTATDTTCRETHWLIAVSHRLAHHSRGDMIAPLHLFVLKWVSLFLGSAVRSVTSTYLSQIDSNEDEYQRSPNCVAARTVPC